MLIILFHCPLASVAEKSYVSVIIVLVGDLSFFSDHLLNLPFLFFFNLPFQFGLLKIHYNQLGAGFLWPCIQVLHHFWTILLSHYPFK